MRSAQLRPGEVIFGPGIARRVLSWLADRAVATDPFPQLTPRERQVLELLAAGLPTTVIGEKLDLASKTINNHASAILAKLQVADRTEAVRRARDTGLAAVLAALPRARDEGSLTKCGHPAVLEKR